MTMNSKQKLFLTTILAILLMFSAYTLISNKSSTQLTKHQGIPLLKNSVSLNLAKYKVKSKEKMPSLQLLDNPKIAMAIGSFAPFYESLSGEIPLAESVETSPASLRRAIAINNFFMRTKKKILIGCLGAIIMNRLSEATIISPSHIISYLKKDFNIEISSGTVYPIFKSLEIDGNIIRLPNKTNRLYVLTPKGKQDIEYLKSNLPLAHKLLDKLLG